MEKQGLIEKIAKEAAEETVQALNQFSLFTRTTPHHILDLRCEFDVPRFIDLSTATTLD